MTIIFLENKLSSISVVAVLLTGFAASAADLVGRPPPVEIMAQQDRWTLSVAPYVWGAGLQGNVGLFGVRPISVNMSFGDIVDNLRFGGMAVGEAHNGTWGVLTDVIYIKTEVEQTVGRNVAGVPLALSGNIETSSFSGTIMGQYRLVSQPTATLDLMAGARVWSVNNDIKLSLTAGGAPLAGLGGSEGSTWVDPMVGFRARLDLNSSWYLTGWGMVGGFGAGSDISWDVLAGVGYQWTTRLSIIGGYRALGVNYKNNGFVYDVVQRGPILGALIRF
jgi:hypothetical protein